MYADLARQSKEVAGVAAFAGTLTWIDILWEEVCEAAECHDPKRLREELIQVAATAIAWVEKIDKDAGVDDT